MAALSNPAAKKVHSDDVACMLSKGDTVVRSLVPVGAMGEMRIWPACYLCDAERFAL